MRPGQVRIIGGKWRGRKLKIPPIPEVRPTPDRVRETLFNWLAPVMMNARCLDLFSGSGALGFEALSREASYVAMIDQSPIVTKLLKEELRLFGASNATVYQAKVPEHWPDFSKASSQPFDIVFLDPPFRENLLLPSCFALEEKGLLANPALIYLETDKDLNDEDLPPDWQIIKNKKAGQVSYYLVKRGPIHDER